MYFLIDYENVKNMGMQGCEYLLPEDTIEIFFGATTSNICNQFIGTIKQSGCDFRICKLQNVRKNALDFYIASRLGELIGKGQAGNFVIVSSDNDFKSIQEYWRGCAENRRKVVVASTIADGIIVANENKPRTRIAREAKEQVSIEKEYKKYEEKKRICKILESSFAGTEYVDCIDNLESIFSQRSSMKTMYTSSLKMFGRTNGVQIYNTLKDIISINPKI